MTVAQEAFAAALFDPARPTPVGLTDPKGRPAGKRFDIYRNNVASSLISSLETGFPALQALIGAENFRTLAAEHARCHPPRTPLLLQYGREMPAFLDRFAPLKHIAYLPDLARLELARRESYHAGDATPLSGHVLAEMPTDRLMAARLGFAPAVRLVRSRWPIAALWRAALEPDAPKPGAGGENVLVARPDFDPTLTVLAPGGGTFVAALLSGETFGAALDATLAAAPDFDLTATLGVLAAGQAITGVTEVL